MVDSWSDAVAKEQRVCDMHYAEEGLGTCPLPQLDELDASARVGGKQFWGQNLIPPTTFVGTTDEGILTDVLVWSLDDPEAIDRMYQMGVLCLVAYGYNAELPAQADDIYTGCSDLRRDLWTDLAWSSSSRLEATKQVDGVFWKLELDRGDRFLGPSFSFQGANNPVYVGG